MLRVVGHVVRQGSARSPRSKWNAVHRVGGAAMHGRGYKHEAGAIPPEARVVDMRSDTLTLPSPGMLQAMVNAPLGDDVYGEDPSVNALQDRMAAAFGKEAAMFLASGSMGNLISVMAHCHERCSEVILGSRCHVHVYEQGSIATLAGVHHRVVENLPDGTFDLDQARQLVRPAGDPHLPLTRALLVENTHNMCGGRVLPLSFLQEVRALADECGLAVHMDGARVLSAAVALDVDVREIVRFADTVSMCFSKGIGAPFGAVVAGSAEFVHRAWYHRKALGGGMRQAGIMAAAAHYGFDRAGTTVAEDHRRARLLASGLAQATAESPHLWVDTAAVESNMVLLRCRPPLDPQDLSARLGSVGAEEAVPIVVKCLPATADAVRLVTCRNLCDDDIEVVVTKVRNLVAADWGGAEDGRAAGRE